MPALNLTLGAPWRTLCLCLVVAVSLTGCSHTQHPSRSDPHAIHRINERGAKHQAEVRLRDGRAWTVESLQMASDSTRWIDSTQTAVAVPTFSITEVRFVNRWRGLLDGAQVGAMAGIALGGMFGAARGVNEEEDWLGLNRPFYILYGMSVGMAIGGIVGGAIGVAIGSDDVYIFEEPDLISAPREPSSQYP